MLTTNPFATATDTDVEDDDDHFHEECALFGIFNDRTGAAANATLGLHAQQHRGQRGSGIVTYGRRDDRPPQFHAHHSFERVSEAFTAKAVIDSLPGDNAIGHNRYATTGGNIIGNVQPLLFPELSCGGLSIAHNGNLTNAMMLREKLIRSGSVFKSTTDTEIVAHLVARSMMDRVEDRLADALQQIEGAYSLIALTETSLIGVRDPHGIRPLVLGKLNDSHVLASETCAFDIIGATFVRDIEPGEVVTIDSSGVRSRHPFAPQPSRFCIFEFIYFSRPDSLVEGQSVYLRRRAIGQELARESHTENMADIVVPVPDSGVPAAIGYADAAGIPFELGIVRNQNVGRTFIEPSQNDRKRAVNLKHNANKGVLAGKRVVLVDDSIVRGTTIKRIVAMVRGAGATEVHIRVSSPPTRGPCFYGIDTPDESALFAATHSQDAMADAIGADSLAFISIEGLYRAMDYPVRDPGNPQFCDACFTKDYPVEPSDFRARRKVPGGDD